MCCLLQRTFSYFIVYEKVFHFALQFNFISGFCMRLCDFYYLLLLFICYKCLIQIILCYFIKVLFLWHVLSVHNCNNNNHKKTAIINCCSLSVGTFFLYIYIHCDKFYCFMCACMRVFLCVIAFGWKRFRSRPKRKLKWLENAPELKWELVRTQ